MAQWRVEKSSEKSALTTVGEGEVEVLPPGNLRVLDAGADPRRYLNSMRSRLGFLAKMRTDRETEREIRRITGEMTAELFNAQKTVVLDRLTASVALEKRETLRLFIEQAVQGDEAVRRQLESAQKQMTGAAEEEAVIVLKEKTAKIKSIQARRDAGEVASNDCDDMVSLYERNAEGLLTAKFERITKLSQSYEDHFMRALKMYEERNHKVTDRLLGD
ncbi:hypothetical protein [Devosia sp. Root635]|uniref:hypothetical protein n=1 Tax=Devosia sp. Root635 TaxID=1736575 RepID=UPI0006F5BFF2|nr:hypothetical protein [Devosia sp. Root635]KRA50176.1 hypothetical protein ASD80_16600 [Devosia sp. Root635]